MSRTTRVIFILWLDHRRNVRQASTLLNDGGRQISGTARSALGASSGIRARSRVR
jgi:hypothetical protein